MVDGEVKTTIGTELVKFLENYRHESDDFKPAFDELVALFKKHEGEGLAAVMTAAGAYLALMPEAGELLRESIHDALYRMVEMKEAA